MTRLHRPAEPYDMGDLDVGDGNLVHWEASGNPDGIPVVVLHGGPGSGSSGAMRSFLDPAAYRIILFDQRNCGRSTPLANDLDVDLSTNTTGHLLDDMEQLREHLEIDRWVLLGFSWGCTLGLAYAESLPERVSAFVAVGVTTGQVAEIDWLYGGAGAFYPEDWAAFVAGAPESMQQGDMVVAYHQLLQDPDPEVRYAAAARWTDWDLRTAVPSSEPVLVPPPLDDPEFQLTRARICTHYFRANLWLEDGVLLRNAGALEGIPATLITGRLDMQAPPARAWDLHQAWPGSELVLVDNVGHAPGSPSMFDAIVIATDQFARRLGPRPEPTPEPTPSAATPAPAPAPDDTTTSPADPTPTSEPTESEPATTSSSEPSTITAPPT
jgi:proline iminopeptidase